MCICSHALQLQVSPPYCPLELMPFLWVEIKNIHFIMVFKLNGFQTARQHLVVAPKNKSTEFLVSEVVFPAQIAFALHVSYISSPVLWFGVARMEDSITSSSVSYSCYDSLENSASSEESGWTAYLEDLFLAPPPQRKEGGFSSTGSSMISDASWKPILLESKSRRKLRSEKTKEIRSFPDDDDDDDPLEDTANSNTASLYHLKFTQCPTSIGTSKKDELASSAQEGVDCGGEKKETAANVIGFMEGSNGWTDLRERGVCLIPFSQLLIECLDESSHC